jgi:hypothetical protein
VGEVALSQAQCRLRGGGTRPPNPKPEQTRSPSPNQSPIRAQTPDPGSKGESDLLWTRESESKGEPDLLWALEPESKGESDLFFTPESESKEVRFPLDLIKSPMDSGVRSKQIRLCAFS